jgi:hypothetical protein
MKRREIIGGFGAATLAASATDITTARLPHFSKYTKRVLEGLKV